MAQPQKETILGNYTSFPRFPLDCESMEYIQENIKHLAIVAQIAGCDKLIIKGCTGNSQSRAEGYVYVRTGDDLVGEILYSPAGSGVRCGISTENINATANNETFTSAYTIRKLVSGTTGEWSWSDFRALSEITNSALKTLVDGKAAAGHNHDEQYYTQSQIDAMLLGSTVAFVRRMIIMWSGSVNEIPSGWVLCDGRTINGERIPDLRGKFIIGAGSSSYPVGKSGGVDTQSVTLTTRNLPAHKHTGTTNNNTRISGEASSILQPMNTDGFPDDSACSGDGSNGHEHCQQSYWRGHKTTDVLSSAPLHAHTHNFTTNNAGDGLPFTFDNRPPFYALCYIMKL